MIGMLQIGTLFCLIPSSFVSKAVKGCEVSGTRNCTEALWVDDNIMTRVVDDVRNV
jgi:hypothetical protein